MPSTGPNNPSATSVGVPNDRPWTDPENVYSSNDSYMTASAGEEGGFFTDLQRFTGFGFAVPTGATINGIVLEVERKAAGTVIDTGISLVKAGTESGTDKASGSNWPASDAYATYGGASDLWGTTWSVAEVNASDFGMSISAYVDTLSTASVDHIRITVHYTEGGGSARQTLTLLGVG
jgi:hypothetical protein